MLCKILYLRNLWSKANADDSHRCRYPACHSFCCWSVSDDISEKGCRWWLASRGLSLWLRWTVPCYLRLVFRYDHYAVFWWDSCSYQPSHFPLIFDNVIGPVLRFRYEHYAVYCFIHARTDLRTSFWLPLIQTVQCSDLKPHQYCYVIYPSFDEEVVARLCYGDS